LSNYLYFKSDRFSSNREFADWSHSGLTKLGVSLRAPIDENFMFCLPASIEGEEVTFYLGKNDEESTPPLWQIWPEQKVSFLKKIMGKANYSAQDKAKEYLNQLVDNLPDETSA